MSVRNDITSELKQRFPDVTFTQQVTADGIPTLWVGIDRIRDVLSYLKSEAKPPYPMLYDLTAVDERARRTPAHVASDFTMVYQLLSFDRVDFVRLKVPLHTDNLSIPTIIDLWPNANWYEREVWDMFGIDISGHPFLRRILSPPDWEGHPLRKDYPARATDLPGYVLTDEGQEKIEDDLQFNPADYGFPPTGEQADYMYINVGPHHPGTHGLLRLILQLDGERIVNSVADIGWHHRAAEKMAERQTFHTYIPYTDRIDYLAGMNNNMPYLLSVESLAGIDIPLRAQYIRVMLCELFRIQNHLVYLGTYGADVGAMSPVFFTFTDRERIFKIIEAVCGGRMHPEWFRVGGTAQDLPNGWKTLVDEFAKQFPASLREYRRMLTSNSIFKDRTQGVGIYTQQSATEWGVTGPNLRATGIDWDLRKKRPYSAYDHFDFEIPTATEGDSYARCMVHMDEMEQSLRIVKQAADNMPTGEYKSGSRYTMPPRKEETMVAIETLINHFLSVSWGQPIPVGESMVSAELPKGNEGYYVTSDGSNWAYRCHIRTASYPHIQTLPLLTKGMLISDLIAVLGSIDYVLADVDR